MIIMLQPYLIILQLYLINVMKILTFWCPEVKASTTAAAIFDIIEHLKTRLKDTYDALKKILFANVFQLFFNILSIGQREI